jgi:hypothetical protein
MALTEEAFMASLFLIQAFRHEGELVHLALLLVLLREVCEVDELVLGVVLLLLPPPPSPTRVERHSCTRHRRGNPLSVWDTIQGARTSPTMAS